MDFEKKDDQGDLFGGFSSDSNSNGESKEVDEVMLRDDVSIKHVCSVSGGVTSWMMSRLVKDHYMKLGDELVLLFADTLVEDVDTYRFLEATEDDLGEKIIRISDGRTPWELFWDKKFLGNSRVALCSQILKRDLLGRWRRENCEKDTSVHYVGLDWMEVNRFENHRRALLPWVARAPLIDRLMDKKECIEEAERRGMPVPVAYSQGFAHSNCGGMCVRAGKGHWGRLYRIYPDRFMHALKKEEELQVYLEKPVTILKEVKAGKSVRLSLRELKERLDSSPELFPEDDGGGCGCALAGDLDDEDGQFVQIE